MIVEGPLDAIAVTLGTGGRYTGLAPLGTALTDQQAALLAGRPVILATDADHAGDPAAERDFWRLAVHGIDPARAILPAGTDPAAILAGTAPTGSSHPRQHPPPGRGHDRRAPRRPASRPSARRAASIIAARPRATWAAGTAAVADALQLPDEAIRETLLRHVRAWNDDPRRAAARGLAIPQRPSPSPARGPESDRSTPRTARRTQSSRETHVEPPQTPAATPGSSR